MNKIIIVAELSGNHNQSLEIAKQTIHAIHASGADAVKLQTYTADTITLDCDNEYFTVQDGSIWNGRTAYDIYSKAYTPWEWHAELYELARSLGLVCFSSPFDLSAVDFLETLDNPIYKIASPEITDIPLIEYAASKHKPIILSTGIATLEDIQEAIYACHRAGNTDITLLKCTSAYPTPMNEVNLKTIPFLRERFGVKIGLSDHTMGSTVPIVSTAFGVSMIEKHFILNKSIAGEDCEFSMEANEFSEMVISVRNAALALGKKEYKLSDKALKSRNFCRSLFITENVKAGEIITANNVRSIRPGFGLAPKHLKEILGKVFKSDYIKGTPLAWEHVQ